jgi:hypothetical protein
VSVLGATASTGAALGAAGEYTLLWQVVSGDGHPVSGEFGFTWEPAAGAELSTGSAAPGDCHGTAATAIPGPAPETRPNAQLGDILWIGGAIVVVLLAAVITFLVIARRRA